MHRLVPRVGGYCRAAVHRAATRPHTQPRTAHSYFTTSSKLLDDKKDGYDYSQDPEVKQWMSELMTDFGNDVKKPESPDVKDEQKSPSVGENKFGEHRGGTATAAPGWNQHISSKYEKFDSQSPQVIYDYDEEQAMQDRYPDEPDVEEEYILQRGRSGVFDVEEVVELLKEENGRDVVVIRVPADIKYVEHMVICSSQSRRHINALAEVIRQIYKKKKNKKDPSLIVEGKSTEWVALDLGNIALHLMLPDTREAYDLETLWTVGAEYDDKCQAEQSPLDYVNALVTKPLQHQATLPQQPEHV